MENILTKTEGVLKGGIDLVFILEYVVQNFFIAFLVISFVYFLFYSYMYLNATVKQIGPLKEKYLNHLKYAFFTFFLTILIGILFFLYNTTLNAV